MPDGFIRRAQPSDIDRLVELQMEAFAPEENIPVSLGRRFVRAKYRWLVASERAYTLVAVIEGKIIGLVGVSDTSYFRPMLRASFRELLRGVVLKPSVFFNKSLWKRLIQNDGYKIQLAKKISGHRKFAQLAIIIIEKGYRGQGIFPALIEAAIKTSRSRGSRAIRAGIYKENWASRRAFEKVGWTEMPELETADRVYSVLYLDEGFAKELGAIEG